MLPLKAGAARERQSWARAPVGRPSRTLESRAVDFNTARSVPSVDGSWTLPPTEPHLQRQGPVAGLAGDLEAFGCPWRMGERVAGKFLGVSAAGPAIKPIIKVQLKLEAAFAFEG
jgi:hypothetical protein